mgnify:FL=1
MIHNVCGGVVATRRIGLVLISYSQYRSKATSTPSIVAEIYTYILWLVNDIMMMIAEVRSALRVAVLYTNRIRTHLL